MEITLPFSGKYLHCNPKIILYLKVFQQTNVGKVIPFF